MDKETVSLVAFRTELGDRPREKISIALLSLFKFKPRDNIRSKETRKAEERKKGGREGEGNKGPSWGGNKEGYYS